MIAFPLGAGLFVLARKSLQFQAGHRKPRAGTGVFFGQLALLVVERESVLFLRLLQARELLQFFGQERQAAFQVFQFGGQRRRLRGRELQLAR